MAEVTKLKVYSADELIEWVETHRRQIKSFTLVAVVEDKGERCIFEGRGWSGDNSEPYLMIGALNYMATMIANEEIER